MYILTLFLMVGSSLAGVTSEYDSKNACEYAALTNKLASKSDPKSLVVLATCAPKNHRNIPTDATIK